MGTLRTLLALCVIAVHTGLGVGVGGRLAVQAFFIISGFLISYVLTTNPSYAQPKKFYKNRLLRLLPSFWLVSITTLILACIFPHLSPFSNFWDIQTHAPAFAVTIINFSNIFLIGGELPTFLAVTGGQLHLSANFLISDLPLYQGLLVPPAWSLSLEIIFYALAPLLARKLWLQFLVFSGGQALRLLLIFVGIGQSDPWNYRLIFAELGTFVLGMFAQRYLGPLTEKYIHFRRELVERFSLVAISIVVIGYGLIPVSGAVKTLLFLAVLLLSLPYLFTLQQRSRLDNIIGSLSYPTYIWHWLIVGLFRNVINDNSIQGSMLLFASSSIVTLAIAYFTATYFEPRFTKMKAT
jgi:peptidoglycan/LPS O-acetylase OafA/YrhL